MVYQPAGAPAGLSPPSQCARSGAGGATGTQGTGGHGRGSAATDHPPQPSTQARLPASEREHEIQLEISFLHFCRFKKII